MKKSQLVEATEHLVDRRTEIGLLETVTAAKLYESRGDIARPTREATTTYQPVAA